MDMAQMMLSAVTALSLSAVAVSSTDVGVRLKERLPKTEVTSVDCKAAGDLCEVVAGKNLFYVDRSARYLIVGRIYDMETRQDLTAARLLELSPDTLVDGAAKLADRPEAADRPAARAAATPARHVDLSGLSQRGAIRWGRGPKTVTVFSDFACGYCRALSQQLRQMNVTVIERPISIMGSRALSETVLCAADRERALHQAYAGETIPASARCDTTGLNENEAFARRHGLNGTPVVIRSDGAVLEGFRPREALARWIAEAR